ncbi:MAG: hypothetical protein SFT92_08110 [Rickettsiales bacterium]|nr:hypothetical protein [Rickettsiales bacterium]
MEIIQSATDQSITVKFEDEYSTTVARFIMLMSGMPPEQMGIAPKNIEDRFKGTELHITETGPEEFYEMYSSGKRVLDRLTNAMAELGIENPVITTPLHAVPSKEAHKFDVKMVPTISIKKSDYTSEYAGKKLMKVLIDYGVTEGTIAGAVLDEQRTLNAMKDVQKRIEGQGHLTDANQSAIERDHVQQILLTSALDDINIAWESSSAISRLNRAAEALEKAPEENKARQDAKAREQQLATEQQAQQTALVKPAEKLPVAQPAQPQPTAPKPVAPSATTIARKPEGPPPPSQISKRPSPADLARQAKEMMDKGQNPFGPNRNSGSKPPHR